MTGVVVMMWEQLGVGASARTCKLGFHALAHESKLYVIQCPEDIGGHDCLFVLKCCNFIGSAARMSLH